MDASARAVSSRCRKLIQDISTREGEMEVVMAKYKIYGNYVFSKEQMCKIEDILLIYNKKLEVM